MSANSPSRPLRRSLFLWYFLVSLLVPAPVGLMAAPTGAPAQAVEVRDAWIPEAPPVAAVLAAYMTLVNHGSSTLRLSTITSPDFATVEIHQTVTEGGMSRMRKLDELVLYAGDDVHLRPGGIHLMLIKPARPLRHGDMVRLRLQLDDGDSLEVRVPVRADADEATMPHHDHH